MHPDRDPNIQPDKNKLRRERLERHFAGLFEAMEHPVAFFGIAILLMSITAFIVFIIVAIVYGIALMFISIGRIDAIVIAVAGTFFFGVTLYVFRRKFRAWYGFFEVISALILAGVTIARPIHYKSTSFVDFLNSPDSLPTLLGLASAVYIVVRGIDNIFEAVKNKETPETGNSATGNKEPSKIN